MAIASPNENVYYYECNNGQFRLFYFMPPRELKNLCDTKRISRNVLEDFPDGVDLGCTEADFKQFKETYDYTIPRDPRALRNAFYAIFSTTRNWKKFRGSGFIPAADLEGHVKKVDGALQKEKKIKEVPDLPPEQLSFKQLQRRRRRQDVRQRETYKVLRKLKVKGIDPGLTLTQQKFSTIKRQKGVYAKEVFINLHHPKRKEE
ncbi:MAG: BTB/POZ domain-containing protein [Planctomycetota bacterium]|jgi:hypothetical protein